MTCVLIIVNKFYMLQALIKRELTLNCFSSHCSDKTVIATALTTLALNNRDYCNQGCSEHWTAPHKLLLYIWLRTTFRPLISANERVIFAKSGALIRCTKSLCYIEVKTCKPWSQIIWILTYRHQYEWHILCNWILSVLHLGAFGRCFANIESRLIVINNNLPSGEWN